MPVFIVHLTKEVIAATQGEANEAVLRMIEGASQPETAADTGPAPGRSKTAGRGPEFTPLNAETERAHWRGEIENWHNLGRNGNHAVPAGNAGRWVEFRAPRGYGGASMLVSGPGEVVGTVEQPIEIHLEVDDGGPHLLVYVPGSEEPALSANLLSGGLEVLSLLYAPLAAA
jgi:hypothetical protein